MNATPTPETILRRIASALGHPKDQPLTLGAADSLADTWVRAMAQIARHVGADALDPMSVVQAVEDRIAGRPIPPKPTPAPIPVPPPAPALAAAPAAPVPRAITVSDRLVVRDGQLYVEIVGVWMRVTGLTVAPSP